MPRFHSLRIVALYLLASSLLPAQSARSPRGTLTIVGGGPQPPALVRQFVDLAGGRGRAKIVVFAQASADGEKSSEEAAEPRGRLRRERQRNHSGIGAVLGATNLRMHVLPAGATFDPKTGKAALS